MSNNSNHEEKRGDTRPPETFDPAHRGDKATVSLTIPLEYRMMVNIMAEERGMDAKKLFTEIVVDSVDKMYPPQKRKMLFDDLWKLEQGRAKTIAEKIKRDMAALAV